MPTGLFFIPFIYICYLFVICALNFYLFLPYLLICQGLKELIEGLASKCDIYDWKNNHKQNFLYFRLSSIFLHLINTFQIYTLFINHKKILHNKRPRTTLSLFNCSRSLSYCRKISFSPITTLSTSSILIKS